MTRQQWLLLTLGGAGLAYLATRSTTSQSGAQEQTSATGFTADPLAYVGEAVNAVVSGWKNVGSGPAWVPILNATEDALGLPADLLARIAYQESRFREEIIRGTKPSPVGALGIMQMMPKFFQSVRVPVPYSDADVAAQIEEAGNLVVSLYHSTGDWSLTLAAYNAGLGNVQKYGGIPPFKETQNYVAQVTADVPSIQA